MSEMKVAVIGGEAKHLKLLDEHLMELIEESEHYLFDVIGGAVPPCSDDPSLGQLWARYRGLPYYFKEYKDLGSMMHGVSDAADYIIFMNDCSQIMKRFIMTYRQTGKHGSVIDI